MIQDWSSDLLLQVIQYLNIQDGGSFAMQSRRFYYLVHQYRRLRGPELVSASSHEKRVRTRQLTADAVCQEAVKRLQGPPALALAFSTRRSRLADRLPSHLPADTVVLGSTSGSIQTACGGDCDYSSHSALMMLAGLSENTVVRPFSFNSENSRLENFRSFSDGLQSETDQDWKMFIVYACSRSTVCADPLVGTIQAKFPNATIVGGICDQAYVSTPIDTAAYSTDRLSTFSSIALLRMNTEMGGAPPPQSPTKAQLVQHVHTTMKTKKYMLKVFGGFGEAGGICGVALAGDVPVRSVVSRGVQSLTGLRLGDGAARPSTSFIIQQSNLRRPGDAGYMFRGEDTPPYHIIHKILDIESGKGYTPAEMVQAFGHFDFIGLRRQDQDGFALETPHPISLNMNAFVILTNNEDESLVGANVDLFDLSGEACIKDMELCMAKLREQTKGEEVLGAVMFSCSGRGPSAGSMIPEDMADAKRFAKIFPTTPCLGFYCNGEIGPLALAGRQNVFQKGNACVQGFTAVFALFIVPKIDLEALSLDDSRKSVDAFIRRNLHISA